MDLRPARTIVHRGSVWSNEEHSLLFHFWMQNFDKIDLPGRTGDKLKNRVYGQIQEAFAKKGFRRSTKQLRKKIQNLKREAAKFQPGEHIEDENVRIRVKAVHDILALERSPEGDDMQQSIDLPMNEHVNHGDNAPTYVAQSNGSGEQWVQVTNPPAICQPNPDLVPFTPG